MNTKDYLDDKITEILYDSEDIGKPFSHSSLDRMFDVGKAFFDAYAILSDKDKKDKGTVATLLVYLYMRSRIARR